MKKTILLSGFFLVITILFSSCSKEDESLPVEEDLAYLSFNVFLNDLDQRQQSKQMTTSMPGCSDGIPAFVDVILTPQDGSMADAETNPIRLNLQSRSSGTFEDGDSNNAFNEESSTLELVPGKYTLEYCTVLDADENVLWIAPINDNIDGGMDNLVDDALPMVIDLGTGVNKSQDVELVCFDDRMVNQYGYLFYDLDEIEVLEFCIFGNYCDESGRHQEFILYEVDVWKFSGDPFAPKGELLHEDLQNEVIVTDYEEYSETSSRPLCITLPDGAGLDEYYIEITQTHTGPDDILIRSGLISDVDVRNLFRENNTMEYYHFREGNCNLDDDPLLLSDHRDIVGFTWEFTFFFGDAMIAADVVFYADGTASYRLYGNPLDTVWGTWSYFDDHLYYDPDGEEEILEFRVSGENIDGRFTGTYWHNGVQDEWSASPKDENL